MKKNLINIFFVSVVVLTTLFSCETDTNGSDKMIAVTSITLNESAVSIKVGSTVTLIETVAPQEATEKEVTWTSSNNGVASVTDGVVTGVSAGTATVTVTTKDGGKTATCQVTVTANDENDPQLFILDISSEFDWHYMIVGSDGSSIFIRIDEDTYVPDRMYFTPDIHSNNGFTMLFKSNGLPDKMIMEGHILYFGNFTGSKCDIAVIYPDNTIEYFYNIETDTNWDEYMADSINLRLFGINLKKVIKVVQHAVGLGSCAVSPFFVPALGYCVNYIVSTAGGYVVDAAIDLFIPGGFFNDLAHTLYEVYGCANPNFDINAKLDCASALVSTAELLSYIDLDLANNKDAVINEAIRIIEGTTLAFVEQAHSVFVSGNDVYIAGYEYEMVLRNGFPYTSFSVAKLWKNGMAQNLSDGRAVKSSASSVYVSNGDVYVAGYEIIDDKYFATLWKNGVAQHLTDGTKSAQAQSVFVSGNDVYVTGCESPWTSVSVAKLWKNGVVQNLSYTGVNMHQLSSLYVFGNDVYITGQGSVGQEDAGILWKNGVAQYFYGDKNVNSVYVSGSDVYMAGVQSFLNHNYSSAVLWKNDETQILTSTNVNKFAIANAVYVLGSDVYVAGVVHGNPAYYDSQRAILWKNGIGKYISTNSSVATSVYVLGNDVYITGYEIIDHNLDKPYIYPSTVAKLWKIVEAP